MAAADEESIQLAIKARSEAAQVFRETTREAVNYREELAKLARQAADTSAGSRGVSEAARQAGAALAEAGGGARGASAEFGRVRQTSDQAATSTRGVASASDQLHVALAAAQNDVRSISELYRRLITDSDQSTAALKRQAETYLDLQFAKRQVRDITAQLTSSTPRLTDAQQRLMDTMRGTVQQIQAAAASKSQLAGTVGNLATVITDVTGKTGAMALAIGALATVAAAVSAGLVGASRAIGDFQEKQDIAAETLRLTTREVGALTLGSSNVGRSFEQIQPALFRFTTVLGDAREGSKQALETFSKLKLDPNQFESGGDALRAVAERLDGMEDGFKRNRIAVELFGRGGSIVLPVLRRNLEELADEAERAGITLSESAQKTAREADVAWDQLAASTKGLVNTVLVALAPLGTAITKELTAFVRSMLGITQETSKVEGEFRKMFDQASKYHEEARRGAQALDEEAKAQERLNAARRAGLVPAGARPVSERPPSREAPTALPGQIGLALPESQAPTRASSAGDIGLRLGETVVAQAIRAKEEAKGLTDEQEKQLENTRKQIELLQQRHALGVLTATQEAEVLAGLRAQVQTREELGEVDRAIANQRQEFFREIRDAGGTLQKDLSGFTNAIAARFIEQLKAIAEEAKKFTPPRTEILENPAFRGRPSTATDPLGRGGVFVSTPPAARDTRKDEAVEQELRNQRLREIGAISQTVSAVANFANALRGGSRSIVASIGQLVSSILQAIAQLNRSGALASLGPIGAAVGVVTSLFQEGGRIVAPAATAATLALAPVAASAIELQSGGRIAETAFVHRGSPLAPIMAQSGVVISGARGIDSQHALLGRGETVVSHADTEFMLNALRVLVRDSRPAAATSAPGAEGVTIQSVETHFHSQYPTFQEVRRNLDLTASETARAVRLGIHGR